MHIVHVSDGLTFGRHRVCGFQVWIIYTSGLIQEPPKVPNYHILDAVLQGMTLLTVLKTTTTRVSLQ